MDRLRFSLEWLVRKSLSIAFAFCFVLPCLSVKAEPISESDFDRLIQLNGGAVPYPFDALKRMFPSGAQTETYFSRSLQRGKGLRHLFAGQLDLFSQPVFFGFTESPQTLEVISWDAKQRRFDFQIVSHYGPQLTPRVLRPSRETCVLCHQGGVPIFQVFPWSEFTHVPTEAPHDPQVPKFKLFNRASLFDKVVEEANKNFRAVRACEGMCGDDLICREHLLLTALLHPAMAKTYGPIWSRPKRKYFADFQKRLEKQFDDQNFLSPGFQLPNLEPPTSLLDLERHLRSVTNGSSFDPKAPRGLIWSMNGRISNPQPPAYFFWATRNGGSPWPFADWADENSASCFGLTKPDLKALEQIPLESIYALGHETWFTMLSRKWPPSRAVIMKLLKAHFVLTGEPMAAPPRRNAIVPNRDSGSSTRSMAPLLEKYCARCHYGPAAMDIELPLDDLTALKAYRSVRSPWNGRSALDLLEMGEMPRGNLQRALRKNEDDLRGLLRLLSGR